MMGAGRQTLRRGSVAAAVLWAIPAALFLAARGGSAARPAPKTVPRPSAKPSGTAREEAAALQNLPYILHARDPRSDRKGVVVDEKDRVSPGLNFFFPWSLARSGRAYLMDMSGKIVWRWSLEPWLAAQDPRPWVGHFELLPDGALLAVVQDNAIVELDRDSRVRWVVRMGAHHDAWRDPSGELYVLAHYARVVPEIHPARPVFFDEIVVLSAAGKIERKIPILDLLRRSGYDWLLPRLQAAEIPDSGPPIDVFHTNHVETFDGRLAARSPLFAKGNLLVSIRNLDAIAIVDGRTEKILWLWGPGNLAYQHDPRLLDDGRILVFDNGIARSQVVEVDPLSMRVTWRYAPAKGFFSRIVGAVQRLPNGNTLVTESMTGYVYEVTRSGEIVWEYANPEFGRGGLRNGILRMTRFDPAALPFLSEAKAAGR